MAQDTKKTPPKPLRPSEPVLGLTKTDLIQCPTCLNVVSGLRWSVTAQQCVDCTKAQKLSPIPPPTAEQLQAWKEAVKAKDQEHKNNGKRRQRTAQRAARAVRLQAEKDPESVEAKKVEAIKEKILTQEVREVLAESRAAVKVEQKAKAYAEKHNLKISAARKEMAQRELARRRLIPFIQRYNEDYQPGWVHHDVCKRLERFSDQVVRKESPHLLLLMPPRHGKSEIASRRFPAWHLGRNPRHEFIACSYALDLVANEFSKPVRETIRDPGFRAMFPTCHLDRNSEGVEQWKTTLGGGYTAAGVGGPITGKGAHVLLIDDPIKNAEEADSETIRKKLWDWYGSTAYTRRAPGAGVLIIQTWWHDDDLAGRIMAAMKEIPGFPQFEIIRYPAVAEQDEYEDPTTWDVYRLDPETGDIVEGRLPALPEGAELIRRKGEALDKGRYPLPELMAIKATLLPRHWSALYQQNPVPDEGIFFHKDQFQATDMTRGWGDCYIVQSWDFAISTTQEADFTVGATVAYAPDGTKHVLEVKRFKAETHTIVTEMIDMFVRWKTAGVVQPMLSFENGQIWKTLKPVLKAEMKRRGVTFSVDGPDVEQQPVTDKKVRARAFQGEMQAFRVFWNTAASWYAKCYAELMRFPAGTHDDQVDGLAWAFKRIMLMTAPAPLAGRRRRKKDDKTVEQKLNDLRRGVTEGSTAMAA